MSHEDVKDNPEAAVEHEAEEKAKEPILSISMFKSLNVIVQHTMKHYSLSKVRLVSPRL